MDIHKINCNIPNNELDEKEWERINKCCINQKHIGENDDLQNIIDTDKKTLQSHGITFEQLNNFFSKIKYHFYKRLNDNKKYKLTDNEKKILHNYVGKSGWCQRYFHCAKIFDDQFIVALIGWGGAETCPFQSQLDKKYHGYEYGESDWIFIKTNTNETIHIGDLLFHQINVHEFFQSPSSPYRVEPKKIIEFFSLKSEINYATDLNISQIWRSVGENSSMRSLKYPATKKFRIDERNLKLFGSEKITHMEYDLNDIYYSDSRTVLIVNNMETLPQPIEINGYKIPLKNKNDFIGLVSYELKEKKTITENEESQKWI